MTDNKSWLWRKRSSEKNIVVADKVELMSKAHEEEMHVLLAEKAELERDLRELSEKLSSALSECDAKDELVKKQAKTAQEALAGWEKAEAKALSLKQELDEALNQRQICEQRATHLDAALKECMQQLRFVREEQEKRIHDVLLKASKELEETKLFFAEKLAESDKKTAKLTAENSELTKMLVLKEQLIEDLTQQQAKAEADINALVRRLEGLEKDNNSLRYELRILEKEVDIRNEEREFNRRTADAAHKQHLENVKKIAKLESECQRLRVLVRKRLPGPAAVAKMKSEVDILQGNRRKKPNSNLELYYPDGKKLDILTEKICALEEENGCLREALQQKLNELQVSRNMYAKTASKLSQVETQLQDSPRGRFLGSASDIGSDDKASCAGSWASALISELEHFKDEKDKPSKPVGGVSDMNHLMDDFAEMEKLALVCVGDRKPVEEATGKELVPMSALTDTSDVKTDTSNKQLPSRLSKSMSKLVEVIEGVNLEGPTAGYTVRVLQWKTSDLSDVMRSFLRACDDLVNGKADYESFTEELVSALEWMINHCFSLQDVSSMKDEIKKQLDCCWDETRSESEVESGNCLSGAAAAKLAALKQHSETHSDVTEEGKSEELKNECESLRSELERSESTIASLRVEVEGLKQSKAEADDQLESLKVRIEELESELSAVRSELLDAGKKFESLEGEFKEKVSHCEEMEAKCLDLQLQLERVTKSDSSEHNDQDEKQLRTEQEFSAASEKLAECQETILYLGKQLKALATSRDAMVSDKYISTPTNTNTSTTTINPTNPSPPTEKKLTTTHGSSLLDKMLAEDDETGSPKTKEVICPNDFGYGPIKEYGTGNKYNGELTLSVGPLAIVPSKRQQTSSGGLIRKLLRRKKKGSNKKMTLPFAA